MTQGLLPFQYESEAGEAGLTGLAGLPLYLELWRAAGLEQSVARHVAVSASLTALDQAEFLEALRAHKGARPPPAGRLGPWRDSLVRVSPAHSRSHSPGKSGRAEMRLAGGLHTLTVGNCERFCGPGNRVGLRGLHGGALCTDLDPLTPILW